MSEIIIEAIFLLYAIYEPICVSVYWTLYFDKIGFSWFWYRSPTEYKSKNSEQSDCEWNIVKVNERSERKKVCKTKFSRKSTINVLKHQNYEWNFCFLCCYWIRQNQKISGKRMKETKRIKIKMCSKQRVINHRHINSSIFILCLFVCWVIFPFFFYFSFISWPSLFICIFSSFLFLFELSSVLQRLKFKISL